MEIRTVKRLPIIVFFLGFILLTSCAAAQVRDPSPNPSPIAREEAIQAQALLEQVRILASPEMEGRASGTPGGARAADYIAQEFRKVGLKPLGDPGGYLQPFDVTTGVRLGVENRLVLELSGERKSYQVGVSFNPFGFSDEGNHSSAVVFAGYGITAPELNYDDYAGLDVQDKIVLVMTHEPQEKNEQGPFRKPEAFRYTEVRYKVMNAREHGAKGLVVITDPHNHEKEVLFAIRGTSSASAGIIAVNALRQVAEVILSPVGKSLAELQKEIDESFQSRSFLVPGVIVHLQVKMIREKGRAANIIGVLPGHDPRLQDEAVVIGAHYDGLGRGSENSLAPDRYGDIHPGADDNASGVAGVITLARAFAKVVAKRTLIFAAFDGEEMGLLGSSQYVKNPPWPIEKTYAMINLDGIGRLQNDRLHLFGIDSAKELRSLVAEATHGFQLQLNMRGDGFSPSDHTSFYAKGRPVLMFSSGPHPDYHRPSDTPDKINREGLEEVVKLIFRTGATLADRDESLTFVKAQGEPPRTGRGKGGGYGAYFGSIPDFSDTLIPGIRLSGVRPQSPAEKAGLQAGDIIVKFGGVTIRNLDDLLYALQSKRPGDQVEVFYLREGKGFQGQATLGERR